LVFLGGLPFALWQAALLIYGQVDILLISVMAHEEAVGWYSAAYQLISIPIFLPFIISSALFPLLSRLAHSDRPAFIAITRRSINLMVAALTPLAIGAALLSPAIIDLLGYPDEFKKSIPLIAILALHIPSAAVGTFLGGCLSALDRQHRFAMVAVAAAVLNPALNVGAIPLTDRLFDNPAIGAAATTDLTELFMLCAGIWLLPKGVLGQGEVKNLALCLLAAALMSAVVWPLRDGSFIVSVVAGAIVYCSAVFVLGVIKKDELQELFKLWRSERSNRAVSAGETA
jgi:O-antigen/teichoic acid export membrane protein